MKTKPLFPKLERGAYTARFRFYDEGRGELFFDTEWSVNTGDFDEKEGVWKNLYQASKNKFNVTGTIDYCGFIQHEYNAVNLPRLAKALTVGTKLTVQPRKWNQRGATYIAPAQIEVTGVTLNKDFIAVEFK